MDIESLCIYLDAPKNNKNNNNNKKKIKALYTITFNTVRETTSSFF